MEQAKEESRQRGGLLRRAVRGGAAWLLDWASEAAPPTVPSEPDLAPLTPRFDAAQHQAYLDRLTVALEDRSVRNIALTGRYGAGKSSVLLEFARRRAYEKRVLVLSLSTLGPADAEGSKTNQIEKELVKQLLHRERPSHMPQSRYQRIERLSTWRATAQVMAGLAAAWAALWLFDAVPAVPRLSSGNVWWARFGSAALVATVLVGALAKMRLAAHNRLVVSGVSAAGASVTLAGKTESYFDQYLDEIVYFFEASRQIDIVIFEDLDRFDDPGIFEALRELNALLNNSKQMGHRTIRFVYALRDSIFELLGHDTKAEGDDAARAEAVRANRTKFFDLVIPIVPFITHRTARDLLTKSLSDLDLSPQATVRPELIDLTARHLPDMRLLTNIRNEFAVFARRLIVDGHGVDGLTGDRLFALVVYKNVHLTDFERVLLGRSNLDDLYRLSRTLVADAMDMRRSRVRLIDDRTALAQSFSTATATWGERLAWYADSLGRTLKVKAKTHTASFTVGGNSYKPDDIGGDGFWRNVLELDDEAVVVKWPNPGYQEHRASIPKNDLERLLETELSREVWDSRALQRLATERRLLQSELEELRAADFKELLERTDFVFMHGGAEVDLKRLLSERIHSELGRTLLSEGYIDRYYTLYVAQYYGNRVPTNAMNFIVQNVDPNISDVNYVFGGSDEIEALLHETSRGFLSEVSAYNVAILDYLLAQGDSDAATILDAVASRMGRAEHQFLSTYLEEGAEALSAVGYLASRWPFVLKLLSADLELSERTRAKLLSAALAHTLDDCEYESDEQVHHALRAHYRTFSVLTKPASELRVEDVGRTIRGSLPQNAVRSAVRTMTQLGFVFDDLGPLSSDAVSEVVESESYVLNRSNLLVALGEGASLSLDGVRRADRRIYRTALGDLVSYVKAVDDDDDRIAGAPKGADRRPTADPATDAIRDYWTIEDPKEFESILTDLAAVSAEIQADVTSRAHPGCVVDDLSSVPAATWESLGTTRRFPATLANVSLYLEEFGHVGVGLASVLLATGKFVGASLPGEPGQAVYAGPISPVDVARSVLASSDVIRNPATRVGLVSSLQLTERLSPADVPLEGGRLLGLLIEANLCDDDLTLFERFASLGDWDTLAFGIRKSKRFPEFMTPSLLEDGRAAQLLDSKDVSPEAKRAVLTRFDEFAAIGEASFCRAAGRAALETGSILEVHQLAAIASQSGDPNLVVALLARVADGLGGQDILNVLSQLDSPYSDLAFAGSEVVLPRDSDHEAVVKRLKEAGLVRSRAFAESIRKPARIEVTVMP